jgi:amino acid permease
MLMALAFFGFTINLGGNPNHEIIGFGYWIKPGPMGVVWGNIIAKPSLASLMSLGSASGEYDPIGSMLAIWDEY